MSIVSKPTRSTHRWRELDYLRGLAALFMIVNHLGASLVSEQDQARGYTGVLFFIGSFAPVLFFFITGVGQALRTPGNRPQGWSAPLYRTAILIAADLLLIWYDGFSWGLDFLGFIGISGLVLELIDRCTRAQVLAVASFALILSLRIFAAPIARHFGLDEAVISALFFGTAAIEGVSYLPVPWLSFPLVGYWIGRLYRFRPASFVTDHSTVSALLMLAMASMLATLLVLRGAPVFRWGTMSVAYLVLSFVVLIASYLLIHVLAGNTVTQGCLSPLRLSGTAAFFLVPVHYAVIRSTGFLLEGVPLLAPQWFLALTVILCPMVLVIAKAVDTLAQRTAQHVPRAVLFGTAGIAAIVILLMRNLNPILLNLDLTVGQIALGFAFVKKHRSSGPLPNAISQYSS